jgi:acyl-CoA reductase-like NAD-dependent aldehyde dehydrogenase
VTSADAQLERLSGRREAWAVMGPRDRARLLRQCLSRIPDVAEEWVRRGCEAKGIPADSPLAGEEWLAGPMTTARILRQFIETLEADGVAALGPARRLMNGQTAVSVFPRTAFDRLLFFGMRAEVWLPPGAPASRGALYRDRRAGGIARGGVALVLGAGNVAAIGPLDAVTLMVAADHVALLKLNPVNDYLDRVLGRVFQPLVDAGFLAIVTGGADLGAALCRHALVDRIHLTGSHRTYEAIVWGGTPEERARRKAAAEPAIRVPVSAELGCVTPVLVVPGPWSDADLDFQARHVASMVAHNGSFNCVAAKVLVLPARWDRRNAFVARVGAALARTPARKAYYTGASDRYAAFMSHYPGAAVVGPRARDSVPWTIAHGVTLQAGEYALTEEAFCGVLSTVDIDAPDPQSFLARAVEAVNRDIWGTLSSVMLVHPRTLADHRSDVDRALLDLRYGAVAVNAWSGVMFALGTTSWGAYPSEDPDRVESGRGVVHNTLLIDCPQKSVLWAPFRMRPTPVWFADHRTLAEVGRRMTDFEVKPAISKLPGILAAALRG